MTDPTSTTTASSDPSRSFFGHPLGLRTLFLTEMFERMTYYGMRAILLLYLVAAIQDGGLGIDEKTGSAIYGLYISGTYLLSLIGGYIADRIIGAQRAVWWGGIFIMIGNTCLVFGHTQLFFCGLMIIVVGVGLLKPNISAIVAQLYPEGGSRRDAGFSIFYMGINHRRLHRLLGWSLKSRRVTAGAWASRCRPSAWPWASCNSHTCASISVLRESSRPRQRPMPARAGRPLPLVARCWCSSSPSASRAWSR